MLRLLPVQVLLVADNPINGIITSLFASNAVGSQACLKLFSLYSKLEHTTY